MSISGAVASTAARPEPDPYCRICPRLAAFRDENARAEPEWFNGAAPSFGDENAELLVVGLAPGLNGANRTGRPFTGDYAGDLLYATLLAYGFAEGEYKARPDDGLMLNGAMITNAVRCVPPQNKPTAAEIAACRPFLSARINALPELRAILCLGRVAHESVLTALGMKKSANPFGHGARHQAPAGAYAIFDSYHCSRYNTNTGRLTEAMFRDVFASVRSFLASGETPQKAGRTRSD